MDESVLYATFYLTSRAPGRYLGRDGFDSPIRPEWDFPGQEEAMVQMNLTDGLLTGRRGALAVAPRDEITRKLAMLIEGECEGLGPLAAAEKYGYSKQRYFQIRQAYAEGGGMALASQKRGPKTNYRRTSEVVRQIIRHRFLDPAASPAVITQKLRQTGLVISLRSVERVIAEYGLQKKTPPVRAAPGRRRR
jgi:hypothetical protein